MFVQIRIVLDNQLSLNSPTVRLTRGFSYGLTVMAPRTLIPTSKQWPKTSSNRISPSCTLTTVVLDCSCTHVRLCSTTVSLTISQSPSESLPLPLLLLPLSSMSPEWEPTHAKYQLDCMSVCRGAQAVCWGVRGCERVPRLRHCCGLHATEQPRACPTAAHTA